MQTALNDIYFGISCCGWNLFFDRDIEGPILITTSKFCPKFKDKQIVAEASVCEAPGERVAT